MSALSHTIGGDLELSASGGLAVVSGSEQTRQSILRRLCTNAGGYIWQLEYGAGLPARVGDVMNEGDIRALVLAQMQNEAGVDQTQPITVAITSPKTGAYLLAIAYTDAQTGTVQELTLTS
ncbi:MAG: phage tail protein [Acetobacter orientalis]|uniref:phage tail protein n=1 Tax=Acetobacter orientalis TaxID=146474 RepID=UPI0039EBA560